MLIEICVCIVLRNKLVERYVVCTSIFIMKSPIRIVLLCLNKSLSTKSLAKVLNSLTAICLLCGL